MRVVLGAIVAGATFLAMQVSSVANFPKFQSDIEVPVAVAAAARPVSTQRTPLVAKATPDYEAVRSRTHWGGLLCDSLASAMNRMGSCKAFFFADVSFSEPMGVISSFLWNGSIIQMEMYAVQWIEDGHLVRGVILDPRG